MKNTPSFGQRGRNTEKTKPPTPFGIDPRNPEINLKKLRSVKDPTGTLKGFVEQIEQNATFGTMDDERKRQITEGINIRLRALNFEGIFKIEDIF